MKNTYVMAAAIIVALIIGGYFFSQGTSVVPSVAVADQKDINGEVIVKEVVSAKPAWLVIQTNEEGVPGPVIGYTKISAGVSNDVKVKIDKSKATPTLHAMIHKDDGTKDKFDFPENDAPVMYKMEMVTKIFKLN